MWSIYEVIHIWTAVVDVSEKWSSQYIFQFKQLDRSLKKIRASMGFEPRWSPDFFQASSFQLLKLENLLRWSFLTFLLNDILFTEEARTHDLVTRVYYELTNWPSPSCLNSSIGLIGRALHRYRKAQGFESRLRLNFFQALIHNFFYQSRLHIFLGCSNIWSFK